MMEEREIYLGPHPTKANGFSPRGLLTLVGPVEDLKVPRVREGDFHPRILPYRKRASLELSENILALYAVVGVSTRKISYFLEGFYGAFYHLKASLGSSKLPKRKGKPGGEGP